MKLFLYFILMGLVGTTYADTGSMRAIQTMEIKNAARNTTLEAILKALEGKVEVLQSDIDAQEGDIGALQDSMKKVRACQKYDRKIYRSDGKCVDIKAVHAQKAEEAIHANKADEADEAKKADEAERAKEADLALKTRGESYIKRGECKIGGNSSGCTITITCDDAKDTVLAQRSAYILETPSYPSWSNVTGLKWNTFKVVSRNDNGRANVEISGVGYSHLTATHGTIIKGAPAGNPASFKCWDYDKNGGDCGLRAEIMCVHFPTEIKSRE